MAEAVEIIKKLYEDNPARFAYFLALSLNNLSRSLFNAGDNDGALSAIEDAVVMRRKLHEVNPARFAPDLAMSLGAYGSILRKQGMLKEAAEAFKEGKELVAPFAKEWPGSPSEKLFKDLSEEYEKTLKMMGGE